MGKIFEEYFGGDFDPVLAKYREEEKAANRKIIYANAQQSQGLMQQPEYPVVFFSQVSANFCRLSAGRLWN